MPLAGGAIPDLEDWNFDLPDSLIARVPAAQRDGGRLLVVGPQLADRKIAEFSALLQSGDVLVLNDVHVRRARLRATRASGGAVEILVLRSAGDVAEVLLRPARKIKEGEVLRVGSGTATVEVQRGGGSATLRFAPSLAIAEAEVGEMPLPPYLRRAGNEVDQVRYQTVYAQPGPLAAAAAPTAGLHLTEQMLETIGKQGVAIAKITLEVGLGTFQPLNETALVTGQLHPERFIVPDSTWALVTQAVAAGRRVVAVGTTTVRALESATGPGEGETRAFFRGDWQPRRVGALLTNFHLPRSSLLMLVAAFAGRERVFSAYHHAISQGYRFYSYGDACFFPFSRDAQ